MKTAELRIVVSKDLADRFKKIVRAKHGRLELDPEGEEALKLYVKRYEHLLRMPSPRDDPLKGIIGIGHSSGRANVLEDLERLEKSS
jgi:hypothetical protein